jgi:hypothetical protein
LVRPIKGKYRRQLRPPGDPRAKLFLLGALESLMEKSKKDENSGAEMVG